MPGIRRRREVCNSRSWSKIRKSVVERWARSISRVRRTVVRCVWIRVWRVAGGRVEVEVEVEVELEV